MQLEKPNHIAKQTKPTKIYIELKKTKGKEEEEEEEEEDDEEEEDTDGTETHGTAAAN